MSKWVLSNTSQKASSIIPGLASRLLGKKVKNAVAYVVAGIEIRSEFDDEADGGQSSGIRCMADNVQQIQSG